MASLESSGKDKLQAVLGFLAISVLIALTVYTSTLPPVLAHVQSMEDSKVFVYTTVPDPGNKGSAIYLVVVDENGTTYVIGGGNH